MKRALVLLCTLGLMSCASTPSPQSLVDRAIDAMGGADKIAGIKTVYAKGATKQWEPEQSDAPGGEMRFANEATYQVWQDRSQRAARYEYEKKFAYPAPRTYNYSEIITPDAGYVLGVDTTARNAQNVQQNSHSMSSLRLAAAQREAKRGALTGLMLEMKNNPAQVSAAPEVAAGGRSYPAVAYQGFIVAFDPQTGLPALTRTLDYDNVWGDVNYDTVYSDWRDMSGIKVAMRRETQLNGRRVAETQINELRFNPTMQASYFEPPEAVRGGAAKPATASNVPFQWVIRRQFIGTYLDSESPSFDTRAGGALRLQEIAPGVQHVVGGSHNAMIVEMRDHLVVFDAPVNDAQSNWVINAAREKYPGKPIRYLVLTHHHMDHAGGVRAYAQQGATIVVGQGAGDHFRKVLAAPFTRNPDLRPSNLSGTPIIEVADKYVMSDGKREVAAYQIDNPHAKSYLIGYVPDAKLGYVTDLWSPGRDPLPPKITPPLASVVAGVKKHGLDPQRFAGGHGSTGEYAPLEKLASQQ
jgi:glyoxylase-like metal-dependent hydrolase (beta-lactamase superfamily II)